MDKTIGRRITLLGRKSQRYIGSALSKYNLTAAEQPFFMALQLHEGATQEELTAYVCVDKAVTTRVVKSLEEKGFLIRLHDPRDRRQNRIYPTEAAKQLADAVQQELFHFDDLLSQGIDPQTMELLCQALDIMDKNCSDVLERKDTAASQGGQSDGTCE